MASELDESDIRIMNQLQENSKLTNKELAAAIHLSPTPTFERVKRLEREGYIKKYTAVLDAEKARLRVCGFLLYQDEAAFICQRHKDHGGGADDSGDCGML